MKLFTKTKISRFVLLCWVLFVLTFQSCQFLHLLNTKKPNNESKEEIKMFIEKKKYNYDKNYLLDDSLSYKRKTREYLISDSTNLASLIEVRVFDSNGNFYTSFSQCMNDFNEKFLFGMPIKKNDYPFLNQHLTFDNELDLIEDLTQIERENLKHQVKNYQYIIVVYWNIWTNHFSKKVLREVSRFKKNHKDEVFVILCNSSVDEK